MEYLKATQLHTNRNVHRDPGKLAIILKKPLATSIEDSQEQRYKKCSIPKCIARGTIDRPLDLHHVIPRSQSVAFQNDFRNHLYVCGDLFPKNHHKALHGEATPGLEDLQKLGFFGPWKADEEPSPSRTLDETGPALLQFTQTDAIARSLLSTNVEYLLDYAIKRGIISPDITLSNNNVIFLSSCKK